MTDLSDILSCDQLDAAVAQQQLYVSGLGWKVAQAAAETKAQGRKVKAAEDLYTEFKNKIDVEIAEAKAILENTPKTLPTGGQVPKKNPDWQAHKDNLDKLTQRRESKLQELQANLDVERIIEQWNKEAEEKLSGELKRAQQDLASLKDAAARCKTKKKSKLAGAVLVGAGVGFAVLGWTFMSSPKSAEPPKTASLSQPAHSGDVKPPAVVTAKPAATTDAPKSPAPAKKTAPRSIMNEPLGEDGPMKQTPQPAEPDKNESSGTGSDHASPQDSSHASVETGDHSAVGNDNGETHEQHGDDDESSYDYHYEVETERDEQRPPTE